jgi:integrase
VPDDIEQHDGFHVIRVRDGKTESAARQVPIHGELIKRGFLDYVATCRGTLFGVTAHRLAKSFPPYRRSRGVGSAETPFHSLRHSFVTALERAGVSSDDVARLAGHKHLLSFSFGTYSAPSLKRLAVAVALIEYPALSK